MEGEPSGFPSPRRAKRITRPQAAKSGENRHDFHTFAQLGVNGRREPDFFDKLPPRSRNSGAVPLFIPASPSVGLTSDELRGQPPFGSATLYVYSMPLWPFCQADAGLFLPGFFVVPSHSSSLCCAARTACDLGISRCELPLKGLTAFRGGNGMGSVITHKLRAAHTDV